MTDDNENAGSADGSGQGDKTKRPSLDERIAALWAEEKKLQDQKQKKRTRGLILIGGGAVADAATSTSMRDWLHRTWLGTAERDREAVRIAINSVDITGKPSDNKPGPAADPVPPPDGPVHRPPMPGGASAVMTAAAERPPVDPPQQVVKPTGNAASTSPGGTTANAGGAAAAGAAAKPVVGPPAVLRPSSSGRQA